METAPGAGPILKRNSTDLVQYLRSKPAPDGTYLISTARDYMHAEEDYDRQYGVDHFDAELLRSEASNLLDLCSAHGFRSGDSILEVGCGTGRISVGLAMQPRVGHLLITDPSPAFCRIVRRKVNSVETLAERIDYAVLQSEQIRELPAGSVSLILLRSVLHHITDVDGFLRECANILPRGGLLICEEPYLEGYMMMGFLAQFIEAALKGAGLSCSQEEKEYIDHFVATMQFYCRRDVDKSHDEDKHLFRPDELMASARRTGLDLTHHPNRRFTDSDETYLASRDRYFERFFGAYVRYCMGWPPDFAEKVAATMAPYFGFFAPLELAGGFPPWCYGTFVFTKRD
jgi:ubiquinone/menaquinone biosynthesis C-methylase UbiE